MMSAKRLSKRFASWALATGGALASSSAPSTPEMLKPRWSFSRVTAAAFTAEASKPLSTSSVPCTWHLPSRNCTPSLLSILAVAAPLMPAMTAYPFQTVLPILKSILVLLNRNGASPEGSCLSRSFMKDRYSSQIASSLKDSIVLIQAFGLLSHHRHQRAVARWA